MGSQNQKSNLAHKNFNDVKMECLQEKPVTVSLNDMPLETRRKEANKPLFLTRYE
jgi:hypothetical protein